MINSITNAIIKKLKSEFNNIPIYRGSVEQGFVTPSFIVLCLNPTSEQFFGKRYFRTNQFMVQYHAKDDIIAENQKSGHYNHAQEYNDIAEMLFNCLELIDLNGSLIRGTKMNSEIVDNVLNFQINYDMYVSSVEKIDNSMNNYTVSTNVKGVEN